MRSSKLMLDFKRTCIAYVKTIAQSSGRARHIRERVPRQHRRAALRAVMDQESTAFLDLMELAGRVLKRNGVQTPYSAPGLPEAPNPRSPGKRSRER